MKIIVHSINDELLVVFDHPPALLELPFAPGERFGFACLEGGVKGVVALQEVHLGCELGSHECERRNHDKKK